MTLKIQKLYKKYKNLMVFEDFNMSIPKQKISCILGPSGCGKTTLLNMMSGIVKGEAGEFIGFDQNAMGYLFQEPRLLPWKSVWGNIEFILKDIYPKEERKKIVLKYLNMVNLEGFEDYYPKDLSGGMMQRVAIARAFAYPSDILLMDEPFKGLDIKTKEVLIHAFVKLWMEDLRTVIFVTHDVDEALLLGDKIYLFSNLPVKIKNCFELNISKEKRDLQNEKILIMKKKINKEFK
ncbi:ABC transporter ATP-binding protein [Crassaminicella profunda]|uniref:ABC transporter ATP-binding protein n=1 Tax=Crassaminicella profunda TaxID=1286698 RepID=UPI001CA74947|nr:ABC transporter ATP-binding protein [Crassaminicella profunda]QZY55373.1 ABC transporter ATP-binding protein [Crassaminicella profunda]